MKLSSFLLLIPQCQWWPWGGAWTHKLTKNPEAVIHSALWNYDRNRVTRVTGVNRSLSLYSCPLMIFNKLMYVYRGSLKLMSREKMTEMDIHARAAVWLVNFKDFFLSSIFVHWHTVRWSLYQGVFNDNLVTHLNIPQRCAAMYLLSTAKLLLHWAISISGWLAGPPPPLETRHRIKAYHSGNPQLTFLAAFLLFFSSPVLLNIF